MELHISVSHEVRGCCQADDSLHEMVEQACYDERGEISEGEFRERPPIAEVSDKSTHQ